MNPFLQWCRQRLARWRSGGVMAAALGVFVVQNHCGVPGVAHNQLAAHFLESGQPERALREARRAVREAPDETTPRVLLGLALADVGRVEESAEVLAEALRLDPSDPRLYGTLRSVCADAGRPDLALRALQELADELPEEWLVQLNLGWAHRAAGNDDEALSLLEGAVADTDSTVPPSERILALVELSRTYADRDRLDDASRVLDEALEVSPENPRLLIAAGELHVRRAEPETASELFDRALSASEDLAAAASTVAMVYYNAGERRRAIDYYERAVAARPAPLTLNNLAWTYAEADLELERAQELSLRAVKSDADNVVYLDTYAEILFRRGRVAQAVALIRRCLELEPEGGEHYDYLQEQLRRFGGVPAEAQL
jgi:tetratricopeptide (TPR) repeat protein